MTNNTHKLAATARDSFGKGVARKLRVIGQTPAVVYGHGADPIHISVETHALSLIVRQANALIEVDLDGAKHLVLVKDVQRNPVLQAIEHIDLLVVKQGEKVDVEIPVHIEGESFSGTSTLQELNTLRLTVPATAIPESVTVSVEGLTEGTQIFAGEVALPEGSILLDAADQLVVHVIGQRGATAEEEAAEAAAE